MLNNNIRVVLFIQIGVMKLADGWGIKTAASLQLFETGTGAGKAAGFYQGGILRLASFQKICEAQGARQLQ